MSRFRRRRFLIAGGTLLVAPLAGRAQQPGKMYRIGVLSPGEPAAGYGFAEVFRQNLRDLGYVEGANIAIEWRSAGGTPERFDNLAGELVRLNVDVIVATVPAAVLAATKLTKTTPIVMVNTPDPVELGIVASLARPGGNVTGTTSLSADLTVKQLQLLKEVVPQASQVAILWNPSNPWHPLALKSLEGRAQALGVRLQILQASRPEEFDKAFAALARERGEAVLVLADPMTFFYRARLAGLTAKHRVPSMYGVRGHVEIGGLMSYWANSEDLYRRTAVYVGKILRGAKPADLPIELPLKFELVVNLKTAKALGLTLPQSLLVRADRVIQ